MRSIFSILLVLCSAISAQAAELPSNQRPMYGGIEFNAAQTEANDKFIDFAVKNAGNREKASNDTAMVGFDYLFKRRDPATAMQRFNQAWLLDPDNGFAIHGMALVLAIRDNDSKGAETLFARSIASKRTSPGSFMDYGRHLLMQRRPAEAVPVLEEGRRRYPLPKDGISETEALLASAYVESGQTTEGCALAQARVNDAPPNLKNTLREILRMSACATSGTKR